MLTYHSIERAQERTKYANKTAVRFIENGITRGKGAEEFTQRERAFLQGFETRNCIAKAYNGYCFLISENMECITMYPLPDWFGKKRFYENKVRVRNVKRYSMEKMNYAM